MVIQIMGNKNLFLSGIVMLFLFFQLHDELVLPRRGGGGFRGLDIRGFWSVRVDGRLSEPDEAGVSRKRKARGAEKKNNSKFFHVLLFQILLYNKEMDVSKNDVRFCKYNIICGYSRLGWRSG